MAGPDQALAWRIAEMTKTKRKTEAFSDEILDALLHALETAEDILERPRFSGSNQRDRTTPWARS